MKKKFFQCRSILIHFSFLLWKFQLDRTIIGRGWIFIFDFLKIILQNCPLEPPHTKFLKISFLPKSDSGKVKNFKGGLLKLFLRKLQKIEVGPIWPPPLSLYRVNGWLNNQLLIYSENDVTDENRRKNWIIEELSFLIIPIIRDARERSCRLGLIPFFQRDVLRPLLKKDCLVMANTKTLQL